MELEIGPAVLSSGILANGLLAQLAVSGIILASAALASLSAALLLFRVRWRSRRARPNREVKHGLVCNTALAMLFVAASCFLPHHSGLAATGAGDPGASLGPRHAAVILVQEPKPGQYSLSNIVDGSPAGIVEHHSSDAEALPLRKAGTLTLGYAVRRTSHSFT